YRNWTGFQTCALPILLPAYFGEFGGQFVAVSLLPALDQLEKAFIDATNDPEFRQELAAYLRDYLGRPTPPTECSNLPLPGQGRGGRKGGGQAERRDAE